MLKFGGFACPISCLKLWARSTTAIVRMQKIQVAQTRITGFAIYNNREQESLAWNAGLTDSSLAGKNTRNRVELRLRNLKWACCQEYLDSATCVQNSIDSRNSAIHNAYHTSLHPSSTFEPRHPSLKVVSPHCRHAIRFGLVTDVRGGTDQTSTRAVRDLYTQRNKGCMDTPSLTHCCARRYVDSAWNDPSAGSPTETLLRLLLPLSGLVYKTFQMRSEARSELFTKPLNR